MHACMHACMHAYVLCTSREEEGWSGGTYENTFYQSENTFYEYENTFY